MRPALEALEGRLVLSSPGLPPVIYKIDTLLVERLGRDLQRETETIIAADPSWSDRIDFIAQPQRGTLDGYATASVEVEGDTLVVEQSLGMRYDHHGGGNADFIHTATTEVRVYAYVLGPAGTPYKYHAEGSWAKVQSSERPPTVSRNVGEFRRPDLILRSHSQTIQYEGQTYSLARPYSNPGGAKIDSFWGSFSGAVNPYSVFAYATADLRITVKNLRPDAAPEALIEGPDEIIATETAQFTSQSYDPDNNQGTTPGAGITAWRWQVQAPDGSETTQTGPVLTYRGEVPGTYRIVLTVTDDEGTTATTAEYLTVNQLATLGLRSVDDSDPENPRITFEVDGDFDDVEYEIGGRVFSLGPKSTGTHEFVVAGLDAYPRERHTLELRGTSEGRTRVDTATVDTSPMPIRRIRNSWPILTVLELGPRTVAALWQLEVFRWEWSLPGARWDRLLSQSSVIVTSTLPKSEPHMQHTAGATLTLSGSSRDGTEAYAEVPGQGGGRTYSASLGLKRWAFGKAGRTALTLAVSGLTRGPAGTVSWGFPGFPGWSGTTEYTLG